MELVWNVDKDREIIKEKDNFINQRETKIQYFEEGKHQSESQCCKTMQDMDCMKVEIMRLVAKIYKAKNNALGKMQNLVSE